MTGPVVLRGADVAPSPWANGQGVTRELYAAPADGELPRWRLSMAEVRGSGEFSRLPGVARSLLLVEGDVELSFDGGPWQRLDAPIEFDGETPVAYRAGAPSEDLGVMVWGEDPARLERVDLVGALEVLGDRVRAVVVVAGEVVVDGERLGYRDTLLLPPEARAELAARAGGRVVLIGR